MSNKIQKLIAVMTVLILVCSAVPAFPMLFAAFAAAAEEEFKTGLRYYQGNGNIGIYLSLILTTKKL